MSFSYMHIKYFGHICFLYSLGIAADPAQSSSSHMACICPNFTLTELSSCWKFKHVHAFSCYVALHLFKHKNLIYPKHTLLNLLIQANTVNIFECSRKERFKETLVKPLYDIRCLCISFFCHQYSSFKQCETGDF